MDGKLIDPHHYGGVDDGVVDNGLNFAMRMSFTCADAGNQLIMMALKISDPNNSAFEFTAIKPYFCENNYISA